MRGPAFIDLFAGIGGMRLGLESTGAQCVFTCEYDKFSVQTYNANFKDNVHPTDIREVDAASIPDHDILAAGFPCQPFSLAGVSKKNSLGRSHGFADETQGTLFFDIARVLAEKRPRAFLLENVKNLVSHDRGKTFETIRRVLQDELGYSVYSRVIDARCFVPQGRERVFIVGFSDGSPFDFERIRLPNQSEWPKLGSILHPEDGSGDYEYSYTTLAGLPGDRYTLTDNLWKYLQAYAAKHRARGNGFGYGLFGPDDVARTLSARYHKDGSEVLIRAHNPRLNPRRLTPREAARLMGFVGKPSRPWEIPVSDTRAYRQFGNAVVPQVVAAIGAEIVAQLETQPAVARAA